MKSSEKKMTCLVTITYLAGAGGFEPPVQEPKSCVLPLDDAPKY